jgi:hypothetical protein
MVEEHVMKIHDYESEHAESVSYNVKIEGNTQIWELKGHAREYYYDNLKDVAYNTATEKDDAQRSFACVHSKMRMLRKNGSVTQEQPQMLLLAIMH